MKGSWFKGVQLRKDEKDLFDNVKLNDVEKALIKYASNYRKQTDNLNPVDGPWFQGIENGSKISAKCPHYEPESNTEGICKTTGRENVVSRLGGCDNYENCQDYKFNTNKK